MIILLDTHVWLWLLGDPDRLPPRVSELVADAETTLMLSSASVWEIAIKDAAGKLELPEAVDVYVRTRLVATGSTELPIDHADALAAGALPPHHGDPFDRMLVAQAMRRAIPLCSGDRAMGAYDIELLWD